MNAEKFRPPPRAKVQAYMYECFLYNVPNVFFAVVQCILSFMYEKSARNCGRHFNWARKNIFRCECFQLNQTMKNALLILNQKNIKRGVIFPAPLGVLTEGKTPFAAAKSEKGQVFQDPATKVSERLDLAVFGVAGFCGANYFRWKPRETRVSVFVAPSSNFRLV